MGKSSQRRIEWIAWGALTLAVVAVVGSAWAETPAKPPCLVVATHNILTGNTRLEATAKAIRETGADIVCLQETVPASERVLRSALEDLYPHMRFNVGKIGNGPGFLSKYPIRGYTYVVSSAGINGTGYALVDVGGQLVHVVNVHLNPCGFARGGLQGIAKGMRQMESIHREEIADIYRNLNPSSPTLVMGDFNSLSDLAAPTWLKEHGFVDSFASVQPYPDVFKTMFFRWRGVEMGIRIDFIFHTPHFKTEGSRVVRKGGSDHALVLSRMKFPVRKAARADPNRGGGGTGDSEDAGESSGAGS